jgi:hypothetical protein
MVMAFPARSRCRSDNSLAGRVKQAANPRRLLLSIHLPAQRFKGFLLSVDMVFDELAKLFRPQLLAIADDLFAKGERIGDDFHLQHPDPNTTTYDGHPGAGLIYRKNKGSGRLGV